MLFFHFPMFTVPTASPTNCTESFYKSHDSISISWDEPDPSKVHGDLLQYIITARPAIMDLLDDSPDKVYSIHGAETSLVIDDLESNTLYNITVSAKNQYGAGKTTQIQASKLFCCVVLLQTTQGYFTTNDPKVVLLQTIPNLSYYKRSQSCLTTTPR